MKYFIATCWCLLFSILLFAQDEIPKPNTPQPVLPDSLTSNSLVPDSTTVTTTDQKKKKKKKLFRNFFKKDYPHPKKAMFMSFIVPGAGQIYNKKYWKAPIAIGATVTMIIIVRDNTQNYRFLRDEYTARLDDDDSTVPAANLVNWANEDIRRERDRWNKWKEMSYIGLVLVQALGGVDAFVDAHLAGYSINEDLTLKLKPTLESSTVFGPTLGFGIKLQLNAPSTPQPKPFYNAAR